MNLERDDKGEKILWIVKCGMHQGIQEPKGRQAPEAAKQTSAKEQHKMGEKDWETGNGHVGVCERLLSTGPDSRGAQLRGGHSPPPPPSDWTDRSGTSDKRSRAVPS